MPAKHNAQQLEFDFSTAGVVHKQQPICPLDAFIMAPVGLSQDERDKLWSRVVAEVNNRNPSKKTN